jgi:hypothetical protein
LLSARFTAFEISTLLHPQTLSIHSAGPQPMLLIYQFIADLAWDVPPILPSSIMSDNGLVAVVIGLTRPALNHVEKDNLKRPEYSNSLIAKKDR